jgi:transcriptional repressor NrdR
MKCQKCKKGRTVVIDSRTSGNSIRRRRKCLKCGYRFSTLEVLKEKKKLMEEGYKKSNKENVEIAKKIEKHITKEDMGDEDDFDLDGEW